MAHTGTPLERAICSLNRSLCMEAPDCFRFGQPFEPGVLWLEWNVFPARWRVDPSLDGDAGAYLTWTPRAEGAIREGVAKKAFPARFGGAPFALQDGLAQNLIPFRLEWETFDSRFYFEGELVVSPGERVCDLSRLWRAMDSLTQDGHVALGRSGFTQSDGWSDVAGVQSSPRQTAVFWHEQSQERIDAHGDILDSFYLYWRGDAEAIAHALRAQGLGVEVPSGPDSAFIVTGAGDSPPRIPSFAEAVDALPAMEEPKAKEPDHPEGWLLYSTPKTQPVDAISFHPERPMLLAATYLTHEIVEVDLDNNKARVRQGGWTQGLYNRLDWWDGETIQSTMGAKVDPEAQFDDGYAVAHIHYAEEDDDVWVEQVFKQKRSHFVAPVYAVHPNGKTIVLATQGGFEVRRFDPGQPPPKVMPSPTVIRRRKKATEGRIEQRPWMSLHKCSVSVDGFATDAYVHLYFDPRDEHLVFCTETDLLVFDQNTWEERFRTPLHRCIDGGDFPLIRTWCCCAPDAPKVYIGLRNKKQTERHVVAFDLLSGQKTSLDLDPEYQRNARCLAFSDGGELAATGDDGGFVTLWSRAEKQRLQRVQVSPFALTYIAFKPNSHVIACGDAKGRVLVQSAATLVPDPQGV